MPKTVWLGAGLTLGVLGGAIIMHLTNLGIEINGDSGTLFYMAVGTFILSAMVLFFLPKGHSHYRQIHLVFIASFRSKQCLLEWALQS